MSNTRLVTVAIAAFAFLELATSLWMIAAPQSFFTHIGPFGPFNGHYLRDVAAFQAGIGLALLASVWVRPLRPGAVCALLAASALHGINHFVDINAANGDSSADVIDAISITLSVFVIAWLFAATLRATD